MKKIIFLICVSSFSIGSCQQSINYENINISDIPQDIKEQIYNEYYEALRLEMENDEPYEDYEEEINFTSNTLDLNTPIKGDFEIKMTKELFMDYWHLDWSQISHEYLREKGFSFEPAKSGEKEVLYKAPFVMGDEDDLPLHGFIEIGMDREKVIYNMTVVKVPVPQMVSPFLQSCLKFSRDLGIELKPTTSGLMTYVNGNYYRAAYKGDIIMLEKDSEDSQ